MSEKWCAKATAALAGGLRPTNLFSPLALCLRHTLRVATGSPETAAAPLASSSAPPGLRRNAQFKRRRVVAAVHDDNALISQPARRLIRFLRLTDHLGRAPWAAISFAANNEIMERLTASHLGLIVGVSPPPPELFKLIGGAAANLERCENLVWITNRQARAPQY